MGFPEYAFLLINDQDWPRDRRRDDEVFWPGDVDGYVTNKSVAWLAH